MKIQQKCSLYFFLNRCFIKNEDLFKSDPKIQNQSGPKWKDKRIKMDGPSKLEGPSKLDGLSDRLVLYMTVQVSQIVQFYFQGPPILTKDHPF